MLNWMVAIIWPMFAHFLGDWSLQSQYMAENKNRCPMVMFAHVMVWTGCVATVLLLTGSLTYGKLVFLMAGHAFIDQLWTQTPRGWRLWVDQGLHLLQIAICVSF